MDAAQIKHMVERFLTWKLPEAFVPDGGITFAPLYNDGTGTPARHQPIGTNLLSYSQAEEMVRHMIEGMPMTTEAKNDPKNESLWVTTGLPEFDATRDAVRANQTDPRKRLCLLLTDADLRAASPISSAEQPPAAPLSLRDFPAIKHQQIAEADVIEYEGQHGRHIFKDRNGIRALRDAERGTGRTTKQMQEAPQGAVFVVVNGSQSYHLALAAKVNRPDLEIIQLSQVEHLLGDSLKGVVVDHAATERATLAQLAAIDSLRAYIGRGDA